MARTLPPRPKIPAVRCTVCNDPLRDGLVGQPWMPRAQYGPPLPTWSVYCPDCYARLSGGAAMQYTPHAETREVFKARMQAQLQASGAQEEYSYDVPEDELIAALDDGALPEGGV